MTTACAASGSGKGSTATSSFSSSSALCRHPPRPTSPTISGYDVSGRDRVDAIAEQAQRLGILEVPATDGDEVIGYYCMVLNPDGTLVEFSHGPPIDVDDPRGHTRPRGSS